MAETSNPRQVTALPAELLIRVYQLLPSLADAVAWSKTCHTLRGIWTVHRDAIVSSIIRSQFECYTHARELLAWQRDGPPVEQVNLSHREISIMAQHAKKIEDFIELIELKYIPHLQIDNLPESKRGTIYGGEDMHPPRLTQTERLRVIRGCYQIWTVICYWDDDALRETIWSLPRRQLYYLADLNAWAVVAKFPSKSRWDTFQISKATNRILDEFSNRYRVSDPPRYIEIEDGDNPVGLFTIWDHAQEMLKSLVCGQPLSDLRRDEQAKNKEYLWTYEYGDELFVVDE